jgi:hypothetical protein
VKLFRQEAPQGRSLLGQSGSDVLSVGIIAGKDLSVKSPGNQLFDPSIDIKVKDEKSQRKERLSIGRHFAEGTQNKPASKVAQDSGKSQLAEHESKVAFRGMFEFKGSSD